MNSKLDLINMSLDSISEISTTEMQLARTTNFIDRSYIRENIN